MSSLKLEEQETLEQNSSSAKSEKVAAILPRANPYLLEKLQSQMKELEQAVEEVGKQNQLAKLTPQQRREYDQKQEEASKKTEESNQSSAEPVKEPIKKDNSVLGWASYLFWGEDPKRMVDGSVELIKDGKEKVGDAYTSLTGRENVLPITFSKIDPDPDRARKDAEMELFAHQYRTRKLLEEIKEKMNPFSPIGQQIDFEGAPKNREHYKSRSAQESMQILATVLNITSDLAERYEFEDLKEDNLKLAEYLRIGANLSKEDYAALGLTYQSDLTDEQIASKWGVIKSAEKPVSIFGTKNGSLPEMFFEIHKLRSVYDAMQVLTNIEKEIVTLLKDVDLNDNLSNEQKKEERRKIWSDLISHRITGALSRGDEVDGIKTIVNEQLYGAIILNPLLYSQEGGLSLGEATIFRLLAEKAKRESEPGTESYEKADRIVESYQSAENEGKIRDLIESRHGKISDITSEKLNSIINELKRDSDYTKALTLYTDISNSLPCFIELSHVFAGFKHDSPAPEVIDTATREKADLDLLMRDIREAREKVKVLIDQKLELSPQRAIEISEEFVRRNEGNLSEQAAQIPLRIKTIAERTFGYKAQANE